MELSRKQPADVVVCSIVLAELRFGAARSDDPPTNNLAIDRTIGHLTSLPFDDLTATEYAAIRAALTALGTPIGANDYFIAAIAKSRGLILVTHNTREFNRVTGLVVEDWVQ